MPAGGVYREKLLVERPVTIQAAQGESVQVIWETEDHYEPVLSCVAAHGVRVVGLDLQHASPFHRQQLRRVSAGRQRGDGELLFFGTLEGEECQVDVFDCSLEGNKLDGVLVRDGGSMRLRDSELRSNGGFGVAVSYGAASIAGCRFGGNRQGEVQAGPGADVSYA
eukprot:jgi/Tetstr1/448463/TSEL_035731.t1